MGIADRDYNRAPASPGGRPRGGGPLALRFSGLAVVHWLIIINVVVFAADAILAARGVVSKVHMGTFITQDAPRDAVVDRRFVVAPRPGSPNLAHPLIDPATGAQVGVWEYTHMAPLQALGHFSTAKAVFGLQIWRYLSFQFLHADLTHLLFNMIGLWFFGPIVEEYLRTRRRFLAYYLICGVLGSALYLLLNLLGWLLPFRLPGFLVNDIYTPLIGASAGVFGVLMACAFVARNVTIYLFFVLPMRMSTGAWLLFIFAAVNLLMGGRNAGGDAAHVGGAIAGFFFIRRPHLLHDFFDVFGKPRRPAAPSQRDEKRLDEILTKVRDRGMHTLTGAERRFLSRQTETRRSGR